MYSKINLTLAGIICLFFLSFCTPSDEPSLERQTESETAAENPTAAVSDIQLDNFRVRAAGEGGRSAAYFTITTHPSPADTLLSIYSDVAALLELHESLERAHAMMGMEEFEAR